MDVILTLLLGISIGALGVKATWMFKYLYDSVENRLECILDAKLDALLDTKLQAKLETKLHAKLETRRKEDDDKNMVSLHSSDK